MELMEIFDFTGEDLEANRRGELTPRQRQRLLTFLGTGQRVTSPWLVIPIVLVFLLVAAWVVFGNGDQPKEVVYGFAGFALVDLIVLPIVLTSSFRRQRAAADKMARGLDAGVVLPLRGEVHAGEVQGAYSPSDTRQMGGYAVSVAGQRLLFNTRHYEALDGVFSPGQVYTVYCFDTGSGKYLLSVEPG